jgi:hypothetical protein
MLAIQQQKTAGDYREAPPRNLAGTVSSHVIAVDSRTRVVSINPSANDFSVQFPVGRGFKNVLSVRLLMVIVPILAADVHATTPAEVNPYVVLQADSLGRDELDTIENSFGRTGYANEGPFLPLGGSLEQTTRNGIFDDSAMAIIPLIPATAADVESIAVPPARTCVNYAVWRAEDNQPVVKYFRPPLSTITGLRLRLSQWGQSTSPRTQYDLYQLPDEAEPAAPTDPSGLLPQNNVQYLFEIVAQS